jgi:hypothetical protein
LKRGWTAVHPSVHFSLPFSPELRQKTAICGDFADGEYTP